MGDDFSNRQCYVGDADGRVLHERIRQTILGTLTDAGYTEVATEAEATRSLVVGPTARWIFIGDTAGSTGAADPDAFAALSTELSTVLPLAEVHMSDSAAVHMYLYKAGSLVDKYGNAAFPFFKFKTEEEAAEFRGKPELWAELLLAASSVDKLRTTWVQDWGADSILSDTAALFGWDPDLCSLGYTLDVEGLGLKYDEYFKIHGQSRAGFSEFYFRK